MTRSRDLRNWRALDRARWSCQPLINHRLVMTVGLVGLIGATSLGAQTPANLTLGQTSAANGTSTGCPRGNGIHISVTSGTGTVTSSSDSTGRARRDTTSGINTIVDDRHSIDTTIVFNTAQKTWTRTNLAAALSVGLEGQSRGTYSICAGVTALMPSATLTIRGARGTVHFAASFQDLINATRLGPGGQSPPPPRRL